jgi:hypothetical protein
MYHNHNRPGGCNERSRR